MEEVVSSNLTRSTKIPLFTGQRPTYDVRFLSYDGQIGPRGRIGLATALLPLLQSALADAIRSREFSLRHLPPLPNCLDIDRLRPDLLQLNLAPLVRQDQFHSLDQIRAESSLLRAGFL